MVALIASILLTVLMMGVIVAVGRRRPTDQPLTWGEAFVAATFVFTLMFVVYGILPHQWLTWADNELGWRSDKLGIPAGPLGFIFGGESNLFSNSGNVFFPKGIPLPNGFFIITAQALRDILAAGIYIAFLGGQWYTWSWWQNRGKKAAEVPELVSAYGRPLVKRA
ncbi:MAG: hypothetical protein ACR2H3_10450 [Acidimicrobiales bacterium]